MQDLFPNRKSPLFDKGYYLKLIKEREHIITLCQLNNQKRRAKGKKKEKELSLNEKILSLKGEELKEFLINQGFKLGNNENG